MVPLISIDRQSPQALHQQIYEGYRAAIVELRLRAGQRIPSTRVLAAELGISRFPVLNAYAQLLAEGYFESRVGSGTVVSGSLLDQIVSSASAKADSKVRRSAVGPLARRTSRLPSVRESLPRQGWGSFAVGQVAFDKFPLHVWSKLAARRSRTMSAKSSHYGDLLGLRELREALANYLRTSRAVHCEPDQVMIVGGSQQALELSARVLFDAKSHVWMEEPGYRFARDAFALTGCHLVPVPVDREGLDIAAGLKRSRRPRAVFVTPSHQFPLGVTMSATRRLQLLDWARKAGFWIIEDDYDSEFRYETAPIASLQGLDRSDRVIYVGTLSKVLFPALRLGYLVLPRELVERFVGVRRSMDLGQPTFYQEVLADFIAQGHFARHIRRMRVLYRDRRSALARSIHAELGPEVEVLGSQAGMHLVMTLPKGCHDVELARRATQQSLWLWPLSTSYLGRPARSGFILGFGSTSVQEMPRAVRKIRDLLSEAQ